MRWHINLLEEVSHVSIKNIIYRQVTRAVSQKQNLFRVCFVCFFVWLVGCCFFVCFFFFAIFYFLKS